MSTNNSNSGNSNRNGYIFPDFSLRRLLLQARTGRVPYPRMCDVERGASNSGVSSNGNATSSSSKSDKNSSSTSNSAKEVPTNNKVSSWLFYLFHLVSNIFLIIRISLQSISL